MKQIYRPLEINKLEDGEMLTSVPDPYCREERE